MEPCQTRHVKIATGFNKLMFLTQMQVVRQRYKEQINNCETAVEDTLYILLLFPWFLQAEHEIKNIMNREEVSTSVLAS